MNSLLLPAPAEMGRAHPDIFEIGRNDLEAQMQRGCSTPFLIVDEATGDMKAVTAFMQPVTEALSELEQQAVELEQAAITLATAQPGERFGCTEASTWHTDEYAWYEGTSVVLLASDQGTEFLSGTLRASEARPVTAIRSLTDEALVSSHALRIEQSRQHVGMLIGKHTVHRAPVNNASHPVTRQLIAATYRPAIKR